MSVKGIALQYTDKGQRPAFEKSEAKECRSAVNRTTGMKAAETNIVGGQWTGNGCLIVVQSRNTPFNHCLLHGRFGVVNEDKQRKNAKKNP